MKILEAVKNILNICLAKLAEEEMWDVQKGLLSFHEVYELTHFRTITDFLLNLMEIV